MKQQITQFSGLAFFGAISLLTALAVAVMLGYWEGVQLFLFGAA